MSNRVLVAESDHNLQQSVARILNDEKIEITSASDGFAALFLLNETCPRLLIAEIVLPGKSGYELCRYVREEPEFQSLPVILLDSRFDGFNQSMAYTVGANVYLSKTSEPSELIEIVRRLLESGQETDNDGSASTGLAQTNQPPPLLEGYGLDGPDGLNSERSILRTYQSSDQLTTSLPVAVPGQAQSGRSVLLWAMLAGVILAALGLVMLERTTTSSDPIEQKQVLAGKMSEGDISVIEGQQLGKTLRKQEQSTPKVEGLSSVERNGTQMVISKDEDENLTQAAPPSSLTGPPGESNTETARGESKQNSPAVAARKGRPDPSNNQSYTPPTRRRSVRSSRPDTAGSLLKRSGRDMKQAGKHIGSGAKHFGQSGGKATVWASRKVGRGVKRVGAAFKKIF